MITTDLRETLVRLGVVSPDLEAVVAAEPDPRRTPELWSLLEQCAERLRERIGRWEEPWGTWPEVAAGLGPEARCFWIYAYLAVLPDIRRWHRQRGVPDDISWATLADLGRHTARCRRRRGRTGLDCMDSVRWLRLHFSGALYALGRLQFNMYRLPNGIGGFAPGDAALGTHIPEAGPLTPEACEESLAWARTFFARHFPEHTYRVATCSSWLLDDQLAEYLAPTSNIMRFQRRFELRPGGVERDEDIFWFVFHRPPSAIDELQPRTTLERAIVAHVRAGRHWRVGTGSLRLE